MPDSSLHDLDRIGPKPRASLPRATLLAVAVGLLMSLPSAVEPTPAMAACGTGWDSRVVPPPSIRVLRTASGEVETVALRRYVAEVMASGEWPAHWPMVELQVGAVATKQYAWYYALSGNHRDWYRTPSGVCYDVRDDTNDQIYRPERADPTARQERAIDRTWGLSLLKNGRFFMTGYRHGSVRRCGADIDGWHLYARSIRSCARKGWGRDRILRAYLGPNLTLRWRDAPRVSRPNVSLVPGASYPGEAGLVRWRQTNDSEVTRYQLQRRVGSGAWRRVELADPLARRARIQLRDDRTHQFRVRAVSERRVGLWAEGPKLVARVREPDRTDLIGSDWQTDEQAGATEGQVAFTSTPGHRSRVRFTGRSLGWLTSTGPGMGQARVLVNGREVALIDLATEQERPSRQVWTKNWARAGQRTVVVEVVTPEARVEVDAFFILR